MESDDEDFVCSKPLKRLRTSKSPIAASYAIVNKNAKDSKLELKNTSSTKKSLQRGRRSAERNSCKHVALFSTKLGNNLTPQTHPKQEGVHEELDSDSKDKSTMNTHTVDLTEDDSAIGVLITHDAIPNNTAGDEVTENTNRELLVSSAIQVSSTCDTPTKTFHSGVRKSEKRLKGHSKNSSQLPRRSNSPCEDSTKRKGVMAGANDDPTKAVDSEESRCPFCQMPFRALTGQSPDWHTMECMDTPLKAPEECAAGLQCDSTIPSHYRRYTHALLALCLARRLEAHGTSGHGLQDEGCHLNGPEGSMNTSPRQMSTSTAGGKPQEKIPPCSPELTEDGTQERTYSPLSSKGSRQEGGLTSPHTSMKKGKQGRKETRSNSAKKPSSTAPSPSLSPISQKRGRQGRNGTSSNSAKKSSSAEPSPSESPVSQKSCSGSNIPLYFSPSGKTRAMTANDVKGRSAVGDDQDLDPVLRMLVMSDSDSNEDAAADADGDNINVESTSVCGKLREDKKTGVACDMAEVRLQHCMSESEAEDDRTADLNTIDANQVGGFFNNFENQEIVSSEDDCSDLATKVKAEAGIGFGSDLSAGSFQSLTAANNFGSTTSTLPLQKQTSLFSFFKPHCHSTGNPKHPSLNKTKPATASSVSKPGLTTSRKNFPQTNWKPPMTKSTSEPVSLMRVPSPPPFQGKPESLAKRTPGYQSSKGRQSTSNGASSKPSFGQRGAGRQCPFYKRLPGTAITVDAFCYGEIPGCQAYVLTHFHYDHYRGLAKKFAQPMYCSPVTANLVEKQVGVDSRWVNRLPMNSPCKVAGVWLTLMEANHCPGAVIILFELPNGRKLLHTGDFRAHPCMEQYPPLVGVLVDELYLDTTYCDPAHTFPCQKDAIDFAVSTALKAMGREPRTLVVCGAYTIGKERIFIALAEALGSKVCVPTPKKRILDCLDDARLKNNVSLKWSDGCVHVLPMKQLNSTGLEQHLQKCPGFKSVLAFEPTGWTHSNKSISLDTLRPKFSRNGVTLYGVPYSEHSSFLEMKRFVQFLRPKKILPTVNMGNPASRQKMEAFFQQWLSETPGQDEQGVSAHQQSLGAWLQK